jgi:hypothetical protein
MSSFHSQSIEADPERIDSGSFFKLANFNSLRTILVSFFFLEDLSICFLKIRLK